MQIERIPTCLKYSSARMECCKPDSRLCNAVDCGTTEQQSSARVLINNRANNKTCNICILHRRLPVGSEVCRIGQFWLRFPVHVIIIVMSQYVVLCHTRSARVQVGQELELMMGSFTITIQCSNRWWKTLIGNWERRVERYAVWVYSRIFKQYMVVDEAQ
jgi:hypothetical protein